MLAACAHAPPHNPLAHWVPSPNHNAREATLIVIHATTQDSVEQSLHTLRTRNSGGPVSSHYLIGRDGGLYQLVADDRRAWHAGPGSWGTISDVNSASIGIELDNNGSEPFPAQQIDKLLVLLDDLCRRLDIPRYQVIGHADMAPTRKTDPGPQFPWARLAEAGFGRWPRGSLSDPPADFDADAALRILGYSLDDHAAAVRAFRLHYRGIDDAESPLGIEDRRVLYALASPGESPGQ
ncbi:MAG: N-acetylmuramoyl-L-alanine amidase [Pseudoxanthomonas sp.]